MRYMYRRAAFPPLTLLSAEGRIPERIPEHRYAISDRYRAHLHVCMYVPIRTYV